MGLKYPKDFAGRIHELVLNDNSAYETIVEHIEFPAHDDFRTEKDFAKAVNVLEMLVIKEGLEEAIDDKVKRISPRCRIDSKKNMLICGKLRFHFGGKK